MASTGNRVLKTRFISRQLEARFMFMVYVHLHPRGVHLEIKSLLIHLNSKKQQQQQQQQKIKSNQVDHTIRKTIENVLQKWV